VHSSRHLGQVVRVLEAVIHFFRIAAGKAAAPLEGLLAQLPDKLRALLGRQTGEGLARRVPVVFFQEIRSDFAVSLDGSFLGDLVVGRPLIVALREANVLFAALASNRVAQEAHPHLCTRFPSVIVVPAASTIKLTIRTQDQRDVSYHLYAKDRTVR
jgi:hypothetical protein